MTENSLLERMHKNIIEQVQELPTGIVEAEESLPPTPRQIKVVEFTLYNMHGVKKGHGQDFWVECNQVRTVEIISPTIE